MARKIFDTNVLSYYLGAQRKGKPSPITKLVETYIAENSKLDFSVITEYEIRRGLLKKSATSQIEKFDLLCSVSNIHPVDGPVAYAASGLWAKMKNRGRAPGDHDPLIAATAMVNNMSIVTCDKDFASLKELGIEVVEPDGCPQRLQR